MAITFSCLCSLFYEITVISVQARDCPDSGLNLATESVTSCYFFWCVKKGLRGFQDCSWYRYLISEISIPYGTFALDHYAERMRLGITP